MTPRATVDLRAYACPLTFVKTRIALERLAAGEVLEVWLAGGEPAESVPRSAADEGHRVLRVEALAAGGAGDVRVWLEKGAASVRAPGGLP
ncbi:MAG TPA: sulfurtransferase TusA family protein [Anaeromyxobacter sp.]|nr:sulfurtransferase TusA family protein [Anaeromyxobacter sp.]